MTSGTNQSTLGRDVPQVNARAKVLGRAQYAGDLKVAGMLHGAVLRSPYPHARIVAIDTSAALALPGVKAVLTGADAPRAMWGVHHKERRILAEGVVRFAGEEVAAVAAASEEIARDALDHIQVEYEELPAILTPEEALDEEAPGVHPGRNNVSHEIRFERGDADAGFASADLVHEATYTTHAQYPGYLEPMATVAALEPDGRLVVWTSTQSVTQARLRLAAALEMPISRIRVHQATTGGGFGGKLVEDANNLIAGLLARKTGKPVRLVNNRLEDFLAAPSSVPERITLKLGMTRAGLIVAKEVRIVADCGAYSGLAAEVMHVSAMRSDNMHRNPNVRSHATLVYTHTPPHGAFRGFGGSQMLFALNSHIHTMAEQLGLDPVAIHKLNAIGAGETSIHGWQIGSTGLKECIDQAIDAIGWEARRAAPKGTGARRRGVGMAAAMHVSGNRTIGNWDGSTVVVKVNEDGRVFIHSGEADMGRAFKSGAGALENVIEQHLATNGFPQTMLDEFRNARQLIARTYSVERALNPTTGSVSAKDLAAQLKRGKPLSDELLQAGEFATAFPTAAQVTEKVGSRPQSSPLDWALAGGLGAATGGSPLSLIGLGARPLARAAALSRPIQRALAAAPAAATQPALGVTRARQALGRGAPVALTNRDL